MYLQPSWLLQQTSEHTKPQRYIRSHHRHMSYFFKIAQKRNEFRLNLTNIEAASGGKSYRERFWKNSSQCRDMLLQVKEVIASFRSYDNYDVVATLIITNFHLYRIQLWWQFFPNLCLWRRSLCSNLGGIDPENCIEPP